MAERTQKQKPAPSRTEETVEEAPGRRRVRREAQGRARRPARRDRRGARDQRRGLRQVVRAKGRPVATMSMPFFTPGDDPGSSFPELLRRVGLAPPTSSTSAICSVPHATTCVALRFADGVVMAGDRRATSGNLISHRGMEKVVAGRPLQRRRHRRRGRPGDGDDQAVPAAARALREGRGLARSASRARPTSCR